MTPNHFAERFLQADPSIMYQILKPQRIKKKRTS